MHLANALTGYRVIYNRGNIEAREENDFPLKTKARSGAVRNGWRDRIMKKKKNLQELNFLFMGEDEI